jgi:hypothetical protein
MTIEADLKSHLSTAGITALVNDRITPVPRPEGSDKPAVTYQVIADAPQTDLDGGDSGLNNYRIQIDVWARSHDSAKQIAELIRVRMKTAAATFKSVPLSMLEDYEDDTKLHRVSRDFSIWYQT